MKKTRILTLLIFLLVPAVVCAQSDNDTDPNRWARVKSWEGTLTFTSGQQDDVENTSDGYVTTSSARVNLEGTYILDQYQDIASDFYQWDGQGRVSGTISIVLETKALDGSSDCTTETKNNDSLAPLTDTPGYNLQIDQGQGTYLFSTGVFMVPVTITSQCNGQIFPSISKDWIIGGADTVTWIALPQAGYHLTGDSVALFNGYNNGHFHWDMKPKEFKPATPACSFAAALRDRKQLSTLRAARDFVMNTPEGFELVYLYYANMAEINGIIQGDARLRSRFRGLILSNIVKAGEFAANGNATIDCGAMEDITGFLRDLQGTAGPGLKAALARVLQVFEDDNALHLLGVRVTQ